MKLAKKIIYDLFGQFPVLSEADIELLASCFHPEVFQSKNVILNAGEINDKIYLIEYGVVREFSYKNFENEPELSETHWIGAEGTLVYIAESFLLQEPSKVALDALEKTKAWAIKKSDLDKIYLTNPTVNFVGRILTEQYLLKYESFIHMLRLSIEERFDWFDETHKDLINRVPLKFVASYLNMTPETLSRLRAKRAKRLSLDLNQFFS